MSLRVTMLGSGTSFGVPVIGCRCPVCASDEPRKHRLRASLKLELPGGVALVDTATDLRQQALRYAVERVDAVLYTHPHADHIFGADELRIFNRRQGGAIPCYGSAATLAALERTFHYVFEEGDEGGGKPQLTLHPVDGPLELLGARVVPVPVLHGSMEVYGWRLGRFAYVTDVSEIPAASYALLDGVELLILGALRYRPHPTHFTLEQAVAAARRIGARRTFFTHMTHEVDPDHLEVELPDGMELGHDGLVLEVP